MMNSHSAFRRAFRMSSKQIWIPLLLFLLIPAIATQTCGSEITPGTASSPAYANSSPITVTYSGASAQAGLAKVELWHRKDVGLYWQCSTDVPKSIPDESTATSELTIPSGNLITNVKVKLSINHSHVSDLRATLEAPDGTKVQLFSEVGGSGRHFTDTVFDDDASVSITEGTAPFTGTYRPSEQLSGLIGKNATGTWKLIVEDLDYGYTGSIVSWCLRITTIAEDWTDSGLYSTTESGSFEFTPSGEGIYYFGLVAEDVLQNRSPNPTGDGDCSTVYDITPPTLVSASSPTYANSAINVTYSGADDAGSGIQHIELWYKKGTDGDFVDSGLTSTTGEFFFAPPDGEGHYYFELVAIDNAGNSSTPVYCNTFYDITPPNAPTSCDSPAYAKEAFSVSYSGASDDGSGLKRVELWYKKDAGNWINSGMSSAGGSASFTVYPPAGEGTYYFAFVAEDYAGNRSSAASGDGCTSTIFDNTAPTTPVVTDEGAYTTSLTELSASWSSDSVSGIAEYQYAIGTSPSDPGSGYTVSWKSAGTNTDVTETGLSLNYGQTYYWYVKAKNNVDLWSAVGVSDGIIVVEQAGVLIGLAKLQVDTTSVVLDNKVVTAVFDDCFYIEELDRSAGIKASPVPPGLVPGVLATVSGTLQTLDGERFVDGAAVTVGEGASVEPIGMFNRALGGGDFFYDDLSGAGQRGVIDGSGVNNIGMLVRTWGRVTSSNSGAIAFWNFDTDPGWSMQGQWQFGQPLGQGGDLYGNPDPTSGYTGINVYGVNLAGDYSTAVGGPYYLTTGPIDCTGQTGVQLKFWRWLNTDYGPYAHATVQVSNNGTTWHMVWENSNSVAVTDSTWVRCEYDISSVADNQPTVYVRWGYQIGRSDVHPYSGWNIDDVEIATEGDSSVVIEDGSGVSVRVVIPTGVSASEQDSYVSVTGISSCEPDGADLTRVLRVRTQADIQEIEEP